jgi:phosphoribosylamine--glycine ligase
MTRIESDLVELLDACAHGKLKGKKIGISPNYAVTVVMASGGYPENFEKGKIISGINKSDEALVFHAGTVKKENEVITNGGRVMAVTGSGKNLVEATARAYARVGQIMWEGVYFRKDIGQDLARVERELRN